MKQTSYFPLVIMPALPMVNRSGISLFTKKKYVFRANKFISLFSAEKNDFSKLFTLNPFVSCGHLRVLYSFKNVPGKIVDLLNSYPKVIKN